MAKPKPNEIAVYAVFEKEALPEATAAYGHRNGVTIQGYEPGTLTLRTFRGKYDLGISRFVGEYVFVIAAKPDDEAKTFTTLPGFAPTTKAARPSKAQPKDEVGNV